MQVRCASWFGCVASLKIGVSVCWFVLALGPSDVFRYYIHTDLRRAPFVFSLIAHYVKINIVLSAVPMIER